MEYGRIGARPDDGCLPAIHAGLGGYGYRLCECSGAECADLLARRDFRGLNVAGPFREIAPAHCDALSDAARDSALVDTLVVRPDGALYGHNAEVGALVASARRAGIRLSGKKVVILGSGGTGRSAQAACRREGAASVVVVSRCGPVGPEALYRDHADAEVLINTTSVGGAPDVDRSPVDLSRLPRLQGVVEVIRDPNRTALVLDAQARGIPAAGGMYFLAAQARESAELFTGRPIDEAALDAVYAAAQAKALNLVLVGMPGAGKTTVGGALSVRLGRPFVDLDAEIVRRSGRSIPEIFSGEGEAAFRELEARIIAEACTEGGRVVACGGGAVLRSENVRALRRNGVVLLLERRLDALPTDGRPLSKSADALRDMWAGRESRYRFAADACVDNNGSLEETLTRAEEAFYEACRR